MSAVEAGRAFLFLRRMREALDAGVEMPEAVAAGAAALPRDARDALRRAARRLDGDYQEDDGLEALLAAVRNPVRGAVNVAAPGTIGLTRMVRMAGRPSLPLPPQLFGTAVGAGRRLGMSSLSPDFRRLLRYGRAVDITRLVEEVGFEPRHTTVSAVRDYLASRDGTSAAAPLPEAVAR